MHTEFPLKIGIVGNGYVGKGMVRLFQKHYEIGICDKDDDRRNVANCDLVVVCVPTPDKDGECDTSIVEEVVSWIEAPLILIKSTVPPGTTQELIRKYDKDIHFSPEFMGEPTQFVPFWKYPDPRQVEMHDFVIVGGPRASEVLDFFLPVMSADTRYVSCEAIEAELCKYMENAFFATKVTFCNEFSRIAQAFGVDYKRLRELWLLDSRMGPDHTLVFPKNPGFGGKCLPKDLSGIIHAVKQQGYTPEFLEEVRKSNARFRGLVS